MMSKLGIIVILTTAFFINPHLSWAQEIPPDIGNSPVLKVKNGAAFNVGWNYFTLGFNECSAKNVLDELQADGGSALKVNEVFVRELSNWKSYSLLNSESQNKKIGDNQTLAFYSTQNFYFEMDQKACLFPDSQRQEQIEEVREGISKRTPFIEKISELPIDLWTKLMDLLNREEVSQNVIQDNEQAFKDLTIGGKTTVNDLGITGKVSQGLLAINGLDPSAGSGQVHASINTLSNDLYLQNLGIGGINILGGLVTIDKEGNLKTQKLNIDISNQESSAVGRGTISAGQTSVTISTSAVTPNSMVFVTLETVNDFPLAVTNKISGQSFRVEASKPAEKDLKFNWWIVN